MSEPTNEQHAESTGKQAESQPLPKIVRRYMAKIGRKGGLKARNQRQAGQIGGHLAAAKHLLKVMQQADDDPQPISGADAAAGASNTTDTIKPKE